MTSSVTEHVAVVESDDFKSSNTQLLYNYIVEKRDGRERPSLMDIDLMDLYQIAPSICIRDVVQDGQDLKCRYWGADFEFVYKVSCSGKLISETYDPQGVQNTLDLHHRALSAGKPLRLVGNLGYADKDIDHVMFEGIMTCLDGKDFPKQHVLAVGQFDYELDDEDRDLLYAQCGKRF